MTSVRAMANELDDVGPKSLRSLASMHRWIGGLPNPVSVRTMSARYENPERVRVKFLFYNTYLLAGLRLGVPPLVSWSIGAKPARKERSAEIGNVLGEYGYDVVALCEVFEAEERRRISDNLSKSSGELVSSAVGPTEAWDQLTTSGLYTIGIGAFALSSPPGVLRSTKYRFSNRGKGVRDSDYWAAKGVLKTEIRLRNSAFGHAPVGVLEIYSTHLFNGGGIPGVDDPEPQEKTRIQYNQMDELLTFYHNTHNPKNVAMVVGDFNLNALAEVPYAGLLGRMSASGLEDLWALRNGTPGVTSDLDGPSAKANVCPFDLHAPHYCKDDPDAVANSERIDFIFVERPNADHEYNVDFTRPRRVPFKRPNKTDGMTYMSDHLGLETTILATPK